MDLLKSSNGQDETLALDSDSEPQPDGSPSARFSLNLTKVVDTLFEEMDTDKSGELSPVEFEAFASCLMGKAESNGSDAGNGTTSALIPSLLFKLADHDTDGSVTRKELAQVFTR